MDERRGLETYRTCHTNLKVVHAPEQVLKETFGYDSFRPDQEPIVDAVLTGRDVLAVMPTGAGKSICYQVPALCTDGLTLVISPLISLMKDQVESLRLNGVAAACLNSSLPAAERTRVLDETKAGLVTLLYVAPERLSSSEIADFCSLRPPSIVAIDEAHCASQWGHDFRPDYLEISSFVQGLSVRPVLCAFTATATKAVRDDIQRILGLDDPLVVVANFDRPNLHFSVERVHAGKDKDRALHRVMEAHQGQCGIVYCMTRKNVEAVCGELCAWGFSATRYHGGLSDAERRANQEDFVY
ncbi:MAG: RecQ family ATP-dependent DNA helicase, partial [Coriobacteriales bacterium]